MILFSGSSRADPEQLAVVRGWACRVLDVPADSFVMVRQVECRDPGCPPVETIIAILSENDRPRQWKIAKPLTLVTQEDVESLADVSGEWHPQDWRCPD
ncbi:MAG: hypothetical protein ACK526_06310 [Planctomyces sp.]|jgi:hypothetical protein